MKPQLVILDFGSQYTQLIARAVRELGVYCEILPGNLSYDRVMGREPKALILSGSPCSVNESDAPLVDVRLLESGLPILGICYGMQLIGKLMGGDVKSWEPSEWQSTVRESIHGDLAQCDSRGDLQIDSRVDSHVDSRGDLIACESGKLGIREYGPAKISIMSAQGILAGFSEKEEVDVWMSHGDKVTVLPQGFKALASSPGAPFAACADTDRAIYAVQFHPEVHHTPRGKEILGNFLFGCANLWQDWDASSFVERTIEHIKAIAPTGNVICALSGGVDSTVAAVLVERAIGERLHCIFVDNGLLRSNEAVEVMQHYQKLNLNVTLVKAEEQFLSELAGVIDPERKRKIIGRLFIDIFEEEAHRIQDVKYLVQGTLYPDVIESVSVVGKSQTIKSHHNVGGLKDEMKLDLIEPLRELFKDEVRRVGRELGIPESFIVRQPFPGPGMAVRCLGEITKERLVRLQKADSIVQEEVRRAGLEEVLWQSFAVLLPVRTVGVMGDSRTFDEVIAIRAVTSRDGMTADFYLLPEVLLRTISTRIVNETSGVNRVVLDISTKPPSTIEWE